MVVELVEGEMKFSFSSMEGRSRVENGVGVGDQSGFSKLFFWLCQSVSFQSTMGTPLALALTSTSPECYWAHKGPILANRRETSCMKIRVAMAGVEPDSGGSPSLNI